MGVIIIAEAGVNHNGKIELAMKLVDEAVKAGVDAIKFQTANPSMNVSQFADKADYQKRTTREGETQLEMLNKLILKNEDFIKIKNYCDAEGIIFLSSTFDYDSLLFLESLDLKYHKVPSGDIINLPYLEQLAKFNRPILLSTGMANMREIEQAINTLVDNGTDRNKITLLHCTTEYPAPIEETNLNAINTLRESFRLSIGYSDHTRGYEASIAAVALGSEVIEKHFTLDRNMEGPDHKASLEPGELREMVRHIRNVEMALGDGIKKPSASELKNMPIVRKSIVAGRYIKSGEVFTTENLLVKRPGDGLSPLRWHDVLGRSAKRDFQEDEQIEL